MASWPLIDDLPGGGLVEAADQLQQGRLARAGGADQGGEFAVLDGQADAAQGVRFELSDGIYTGDVLDPHDFHRELLYFSARRAVTGSMREASRAG